MIIALSAGLFLFLALAAGSIAVFAPAGRRMDADARVRALRPQLAAAESTASRKKSRRSLTGLLGHGSWAQSTARELQQADIQLRVGEYLLIRLLAALGLFVLPVLLLQAHPAAIVIGVGGIGAGFFLPALYVKAARRRRLGRIERQLLEFLPALAASLRSGFAFQPAVEVSLQQTGAPLADELGLMLKDVQLGAPTQTALQDMGERIGSTDLDMVITAILVQRTTGGNLPEILDSTAEALRERERIQGDIQTFTAQQRMTGIILSVYPVAVGLVLLAIMPSVWSKLFTEPAGQVQLAIAFTLQVLGFVAMRRALRVEV
ncbi:MAG: type II secretion system F family protein [Dehalococcoidia bacterium]